MGICRSSNKNIKTNQKSENQSIINEKEKNNDNEKRKINDIQLSILSRNYEEKYLRFL